MRPALEDPFHLSRGARGRKHLRPLPHHAVHNVYLLERRANSLGRRHRRGHVDRPELAAEAALAQPFDVGVELGHAALMSALEKSRRIDAAQRQG